MERRSQHTSPMAPAASLTGAHTGSPPLAPFRSLYLRDPTTPTTACKHQKAAPCREAGRNDTEAGPLPDPGSPPPTHSHAGIPRGWNSHWHHLPRPLRQEPRPWPTLRWGGGCGWLGWVPSQQRKVSPARLVPRPHVAAPTGGGAEGGFLPL